MRPRPHPTRLLGFLFPALVLAAGALSEVSLEPDRPQAEVGRVDLPVSGERWTSEPIRLDATAIGLVWEGEDPDQASVRVSRDGQTWGPWTDIHDPDGHGPDLGTEEAAHAASAEDVSEAVYVGEARWLQLHVEGAPPELDVTYVDTSGRGRSLSEKLSSFVGRIRFGDRTVATAAPDQPNVIPRSDWGGDECVASNPDFRVRYVDRVEVLFVHHTVHSASANAYGPDDVDDLLYAICNFHVGVNGWNDIAYNAIVDTFGRVWEGRAGGLDRPVLGAHTGGFNSYSTGVAFLGDHRSTVPSPEAQQAFVDFAAWKLDVHHVDPRSVVEVESLGSSKWSEGTEVPFRGLAAHRDASETSCPGDGAYPFLETWRSLVAETGGPKIFGGWPAADPIPGSAAEGYEATPFEFHLSEEMVWALTVHAPDGTEVLREEGTGTEEQVVWDGTSAGARLPYGDYTVRVEALPTSGAPAPRPAEFTFTLGRFEPPFSDDEGSVHEDDIRTIFEAGVTTGCDSELFCPRDELERWQMALFLTRLHGAAGLSLPAPEETFTDVAAMPGPYQEAIGQLAALGITQGTGEGRFDPSGRVSRWQMALFLVRWLEVGGVPIPEVDETGFEDVASLPVETQEAIGAIAGLGITQGTAEGRFDPEGRVTREQMASFLARTLAMVPSSTTTSPTSPSSTSTTTTTP